MMLLDSEFEEFRALPIILQHRMLVAELDTIAGVIDSWTGGGAEGDPTAARLLLLVGHFTQALPTHFATEEKSTAALLRDGADPEFRRRLLALDSEHPQLLACFQAAVQQLSDFCAAGNTQPKALQPAITDLKLAIAEFRRHEAAEDQLFVE
ncbi:MAG TPA: hemerythrin domain-containing protein [Polyangiaceae bacterium]|nr:hemerythrin domain-containing protein [Polyangiaceae bacterium]